MISEMPLTGFLAGTRITTPAGPVPIEALVDGEIIASCDGRFLQIVRIHRQRCDPTSWHRRSKLPICIRRNSLSDGLPNADLYLASDQTLEIDGLRVTARMLMDGAEIVRCEVPEPITYYSLEFSTPGSIWVAGLFTRGNESCQTNPHSDPVRALRQKLLGRRHLAGYTLSPDPNLRAVARTITLSPVEQNDKTYVYELPPGITELRLVSRRFVPEEIWSNTPDSRCLGVGLASTRIEGDGQVVDIDLDDPQHRGLHLREDHQGKSWRWTNGEAVLQCKALTVSGRLIVDVAVTGAYWINQDAGPSNASTSVKQVVVISGEPETPGHVYRVERHVETMNRLGWHAVWMCPSDVPVRMAEIAVCEVLIIWRTADETNTDAAIETARRVGASIVFDIDDLVVEPTLATAETIDAIRFNKLDAKAVAALYSKFRRIAGCAHVCTCTTAELAHYLQAMGRSTHVLPNTFDARTLRVSRNLLRRRLHEQADGLVRIGYAAGTFTHQRDMNLAANALARILNEFADCRLVLFRHEEAEKPTVDIAELPALQSCAEQIEWRWFVPLAELPAELVRLDINIAPVEIGNPFCEAKSELKFFEAAIAGVCTVASPTGPLRRAIRHGETGFLAATDKEWYSALRQLVRDGSLRRRMAAAAYHDVLWNFGPERKAELLSGVLDQLSDGRQAARAFAAHLHYGAAKRNLPHVPRHEVIYRADRFGDAKASVIIPVFNYRQFVTEALDSVARQTEQLLDLIVVDDQSTDDSLAVTLDWANENQTRFNRVLVLQNLVNSGLGLTRNVAFSAAETPWVLPLDADNRLRPTCIATCLSATETSGAAFFYPAIQQFGLTTELMNTEDYHANRLAGGNFIDAMALVSKAAWAAVGGYQHVEFGWEDYDFWCRLAEMGLWGERIDQMLAEYRVHQSSMLRTTTEIARNKRRLLANIQQRHPWLQVKSVLATDKANAPASAKRGNGANLSRSQMDKAKQHRV